MTVFENMNAMTGSISFYFFILLFETIESRIWVTTAAKSYYDTKTECEGYQLGEMLELRSPELNEDFNALSKQSKQSSIKLI